MFGSGTGLNSSKANVNASSLPRPRSKNVVGHDKCWVETWK